MDFFEDQIASVFFHFFFRLKARTVSCLILTGGLLKLGEPGAGGANFWNDRLAIVVRKRGADSILGRTAKGGSGEGRSRDVAASRVSHYHNGPSIAFATDAHRPVRGSSVRSGHKN